MRDLLRIKLLFLVSIVFLLGLAACSDDDTTTPEAGETDNVAPVVTEFDPDDGDSGVAVDEDIVIRFSEAMDRTTAEGNVTLSSGTITDFGWESDTFLWISHSDWEEGVEVTVTAGTGLTDQAGNALALAFSTSFFTASTVPVLLYSDPADGAIDVLRNFAPVLTFSHEMDLTSLSDALTITEPGLVKAVPAYELGEIDSGTYRIVFAEPLTASQEYRIQVSTEAMTTGQINLSAAVDFSFTTGADVDNTPPTITSMTPASGTTAPTSQGTVNLFFSEAIDPESFGPTELSAQYNLYMAAQPVWTAPDQMTLFLRTPLPTGVNFKAIFGAGSFRDLIGNENTAAYTAEFTVAGTPDYFPVNPAFEYHFWNEVEGYDPESNPTSYTYEENVKVLFDNIDGELFERFEYYQEGDFWNLDDHWLMRKTSEGIAFRGFEEGDGTVMFTPEIDYVPQPIPATWSGTAVMSLGELTADLTFSGERIETGVDLAATFEEHDEDVFYYDCIVADLTHVMAASDGGAVMTEGTDRITFCPGIGIVKVVSQETDFENEPSSTEASVMMIQYIDWIVSR